MAGEFKKKDVSHIRQSVRKDGYWSFFKRNLQIQFSLFDRKLDILDLGSGTGDNCILIHKALSFVLNKYVCIDASEEMLDFIRLEKFDDTELICKNLEFDSDLPKSDVVLTKFMFHHIKHKKQLLQQIYDSLNVNGSLLMIDKFPILPVFLVKFIEFFFHVFKIKRLFGTHFYISYPDFKKFILDCGFDIEDEIIKKPKSLKNFYVIRVFLVLRKVDTNSDDKTST